MKRFFTLILVVLTTGSFAQTDLHLTFPPKIGGNDLVVGADVQDLNGVTMRVDDFCYYLSNIHIYHDGGQDLDLSDTVIIIKDDAYDIYMGNYNITNIESIDFGVGVPQDVNHLDITQYDESNPLSWQSPSMHWGWTSGYKFMLINAWGDGTGDGNPESVFQLHNLGDANYKYVSMPVVQTNFPTHVSVVINCNADEWIYGANPGTTGALHGTTGLNAQTMGNVNNRVVFEQGAEASISEVTEEGTILFNVQGENIEFTWKDVAAAESFRLIGTNGQILSEGPAAGFGSQTIENLASGSYFFYILADNGRVLNSIQAIK